MSIGRLLAVIAGILVALILGALSYVAFGDLSRHQGRIESLVTKKIGRPFAIVGAFEFDLLPEVSVLAERVRVGNAAWGSQPQMVEFGRLATKIRLWSLVSGPVDVRSLELGDVSVVLERNADGQANWDFRDAPAARADTGRMSTGATEVPVVFRDARLGNVRVTWRESGQPERVVRVETLTIAQRPDSQLAISGQGSFDQYAATLSGDVGPLDAILAGRDMRLSLQAAIGKLRIDASGAIGRLDPLDGADLTLKIESPDLGSILDTLKLPPIASGALRVDARLSDAGKSTGLEFDAALGDITLRAKGSVKALAPPGTELRFEGVVPDAARFAEVFGLTGLPAGKLEVNGHAAISRKELKFDDVTATLAGIGVTAEGALRGKGEGGPAIRFELATASMATLRAAWPAIPLTARGDYTDSSGDIALKNLELRVGASDLTGSVTIRRTDRKLIEADLASPRLDLTPFMKKKPSVGSGTVSAGRGKSVTTPGRKKFVFDEAPLSFVKLRSPDVRLHLLARELKLEQGLFRDVDGTFTADGGRQSLQGRAKGANGGSIDGSIAWTPTERGATDMLLQLDARNIRTGLSAGGTVKPEQAPTTNFKATLRGRGASARQLAASANGRVLITQGPGLAKRGIMGAMGGDILAELARRLNPFAAQDPYTKFECTVILLDIVNGQATVDPVLMQSEKVSVTAKGRVDLRTESLAINFSTRPRKGIGISAGMFTNPFIELSGSLANPRIGVGGKGATAGALAAATGGISVLAQGMSDRVRGEADLCKKIGEQAAGASASRR